MLKLESSIVECKDAMNAALAKLKRPNAASIVECLNRLLPDMEHLKASWVALRGTGEDSCVMEVKLYVELKKSHELYRPMLQTCNRAESKPIFILYLFRYDDGRLLPETLCFTTERARHYYQDMPLGDLIQAIYKTGLEAPTVKAIEAAKVLAATKEQLGEEALRGVDRAITHLRMDALVDGDADILDGSVLDHIVTGAATAQPEDDDIPVEFDEETEGDRLHAALERWVNETSQLVTVLEAFGLDPDDDIADSIFYFMEDPTDIYINIREKHQPEDIRSFYIAALWSEGEEADHQKVRVLVDTETLLTASLGYAPTWLREGDKAIDRGCRTPEEAKQAWADIANLLKDDEMALIFGLEIALVTFVEGEGYASEDLFEDYALDVTKNRLARIAKKFSPASSGRPAKQQPSNKGKKTY